MSIYEVKTKNGRLFRVMIENKSQLKKLHKAEFESKGKYEEIVEIKEVLCGIHSASSFFKVVSTLQ